MSQDAEMQTTALLLRGLLSKMPEADRLKAAECEQKLQAIVSEYGELGQVVASMVAAESLSGDEK